MIMHGCHDAINTKVEKLHRFLGSQTLGCYNSTPLTGISSRDSKIAERSRDTPHED